MDPIMLPPSHCIEAAPSRAAACRFVTRKNESPRVEDK